MFHSAHRPYSGAAAAAASSASAAASSSSAAAAAAPSSSSSSVIANLRRVLALNAEYASFLRNQMDAVSSLLTVNLEKQRLVAQIAERGLTQQAEVSSSAPPKKDALINRTAIFAAPFFVDSHGNTPPPNPDTLRKQRLRGTMPAEHKAVPWTSLERYHLQRGVRTQNQKHIMKQAMEKAKSQLATQRDPAALRSDLAAANDRMQLLQPSDYELTADDIDWNNVSSRYVRSRSPVECMIQWRGVEDPDINNTPWTPAEHKQLIALASKYGQHSWLQVAKDLNTNRTAMQCFREFQSTKLHKHVSVGKWTLDEDSMLVKLVEQYGERDWRSVALHLPNKTNRQCMVRWLKSTDPQIRSGRWTTEESMRLLLTVQAYELKKSFKDKPATKKKSKKDAAAAAAAGESEADAAAASAAENSNELTWTQARLHIPGRTDVKCREHWSVINPALNKGDWTEEEDKRLRALVLQYQSQLKDPTQSMPWSRIAKEMGNGRTDNHVMQRWKKKLAKESGEPSAAAAAGAPATSRPANKRGGGKTAAARNQPPLSLIDHSALVGALPASGMLSSLLSPPSLHHSLLKNANQRALMSAAAATTPRAQFDALAAFQRQIAAMAAATASVSAPRPAPGALPSAGAMPPLHAHFGHTQPAAAAASSAAAAASAASARPVAHVSAQEQLYAQHAPTMAPGSPTLRGQSATVPLGRQDVDQSTSSLLRSPHVMSLRAQQLGSSSAQLLHSPHHGASQHPPTGSLDDFNLLQGHYSHADDGPEIHHRDDDGAHHGLQGQDSGRHAHGEDFHADHGGHHQDHTLDPHAHLMLGSDEFAPQHGHTHGHAHTSHAAQQHSMHHGAMMGAHGGGHDDEQGDPHDDDDGSAHPSAHAHAIGEPAFGSHGEYGGPADEGHHQFLDFQPPAEAHEPPPAAAAAAGKRKTAHATGGRKRSKHNPASSQH